MDVLISMGDSGGNGENASDEDIWLVDPGAFWASLGDSVRTDKWTILRREVLNEWRN